MLMHQKIMRLDNGLDLIDLHARVPQGDHSFYKRYAEKNGITLSVLTNEALQYFTSHYPHYEKPEVYLEHPVPQS